MNTLNLTDDELSSVVCALRSKADADRERAYVLMDVQKRLAETFRHQAERLSALADKLEESPEATGADAQLILECAAKAGSVHFYDDDCVDIVTRAGGELIPHLSPKFGEETVVLPIANIRVIAHPTLPDPKTIPSREA